MVRYEVDSSLDQVRSDIVPRSVKGRSVSRVVYAERTPSTIVDEQRLVVHGVVERTTSVSPEVVRRWLRPLVSEEPVVPLLTRNWLAQRFKLKAFSDDPHPVLDPLLATGGNFATALMAADISSDEGGPAGREAVEEGGNVTAAASNKLFGEQRAPSHMLSSLLPKMEAVHLVEAATGTVGTVLEASFYTGAVLYGEAVGRCSIREAVGRCSIR